ncbi:MAG: ATP synthase F1 subunit delta, partial [Cyanobacteria bacterium J06659_2]
IFNQYQILLRELKGVVLAEVVSAVGLSEDQANLVRQRVLEMTGASGVELESTVDSDLLGGVIIKVGSQVIDASLRSQIRRLSLQLSSVVV